MADYDSTSREKPYVLAIIPARGGSKGIPRKNMKMIAGKPLIAWSIGSAKESKLLDKFVVSTEDKEIADVSRKYGAEVVDRPKELASDTAMTLPVLQQVLQKIDADIVVLLQPTSPMRSKGLIDRCIKQFLETKVESLATGFICKFMEYGSYSKRRQELKGFFYDDGNVYVIDANLIRNGKMVGEKKGHCFTTREENTEIDDEFDFWLVEKVLQERMK
ncbi:MAG: acylneuraminate cytidylyltransferase family protein [Candidatus Micrarchaeota archaeon]